VRVTADAVSSPTSSGAVAEVFDGRLLTMTPVASRDVGEYAWQAPGAAPPAPGSRLSGEGGTPANVAGARETSNNFPSRRCRQQRPVPEPCVGDAEPRRSPGIHSPHQHLRRSVRPQRRCSGQRRRQVGERTAVRIGIRVLSRSRTRSARPFDLASQPEPVPATSSGGRHPGRTACQTQEFLFRQRGGHARSDRDDETRACADGCGAGRGLQRGAFPIIDPLSGEPFPAIRFPHRESTRAAGC
jgi:hypothetical protein